MANPYSVMTKEEEKSWLQRHPFFQGLLDSAAEAASFPLRSPALPAQMMRAGMAAIGAAPEQSIKPPPEGSDAASPYALGRITADTAGLMLGARGGMPGAAARIENPYARQAGAINWHGTGARFNQFDDAFMGSGEGAQAFGWGHYTADRKGIAKDYFKKLARRQPGVNKIDGAAIDPTNFYTDKIIDQLKLGDYENELGNALMYALEDGRDIRKTLARQAGVANAERRAYLEGASQASSSLEADTLRSIAAERAAQVDALKAARQRIEYIAGKSQGSLMKVDIPDDEVARMLVQDFPMSEQPKNVQRAARRLMYGEGPDAPHNELARIMKAMSKEDRRALRDYINSPATEYGMAERSTNPLFEAVDRATRKALPNRYADRAGRVLVDGMLYDKGTRGEEIWRELFQKHRESGMSHGIANEAASRDMQHFGIPGMRFADASSRGSINPRSPDATFNTISFDPRLIRILEINGEATGLKPWRPGEYQNMLLDAMRSAGR